MHAFVADLKYAVRLMLRSPGFTAVALLTLALGIGANTAIFSLVNAAMIRPLPYPHADRLMRIFHSYKKLNLRAVTVSPQGYYYYRQNNRVFQSVAAASPYKAPQNLTGAGEPQNVRTNRASWNLFDTLQVRPLLGRGFTEAEEVPGKDRVAVLTYAIWKSTFGGDPTVVGREITLDGANYTVIGVMPAGFEYPEETRIWVPLALTPEERNSGGVEFLQVVGRLKDGATVAQAEADMQRMTSELVRLNNDPNVEGWSAITMPMRTAEVGDMKSVLWVLLAAVACVLLIACANLANLLLARATSRQREIAIRAALGAGRLRMVKQILTEGILLSLAGGALGLALGYAALQFMLARLPLKMPTNVHVTVDNNVLFFTLAISLLTGFVFSAVPALRLSRGMIPELLKDGGVKGGPSRHRVGAMIVIGEFALSLVLLIGAGLLIRTFVSIQSSDPGFKPKNVLTAQVSLPSSRYAKDEQVTQFVNQTLAELRAQPGVEYAGITSGLPLTTDWMNGFRVKGKQLNPPPHVHAAAVSDGYFATMSIPLVRGRFIEATDKGDSPQVAVIDTRTAAAYFPNEDPVGKQIETGSALEDPAKAKWITIVGVVGAVKHTSPLEDETKGQIYFAHTQRPVPRMFFTIRTSQPPTEMAGVLRKTIRDTDALVPITEIKTMEAALDDFVAQPRFNMLLICIFAVLALTLSAVGIYGLIAYVVTQRTNEIGIRMALGAQRGDVLGMILRDGMKMAAVGLAIGLVASALTGRMLQSMLFGVQPMDPVTLSVVSAVLIVIALIASAVPAWRATRVDPSIALRQQ